MRWTPRAVVWKGPELPVEDQGIKVLGTPLGHPEFVTAHLERITAEHRVLLDRIPAVQDVQSAWLILLHCAAARANYLLRVVPPELVRQFAESHDAGLWRCLCQILDIPEGQCEATARIASSMPLLLGGIGLRSAVRTSLPAYWASWGDCLHMVHQRHPDIAEVLVNHLEAGGDTPYLSAAVAAARELMGVEGFEPPSWSALALGARPPPPQEDFELDALRGGWQHEVSARVERQFRERNVLPVLTDGERALLRSQSGSGAGAALSTVPCDPLRRIEPQLFRVLLLRRLRLPLPLGSALLPVWPSTRLFWPSPRIMCQSWGSWEERLCPRKRCGESVP